MLVNIERSARERVVSSIYCVCVFVLCVVVCVFGFRRRNGAAGRCLSLSHSARRLVVVAANDGAVWRPGLTRLPATNARRGHSSTARRRRPHRVRAHARTHCSFLEPVGRRLCRSFHSSSSLPLTRRTTRPAGPSPTAYVQRLHPGAPASLIVR